MLHYGGSQAAEPQAPGPGPESAGRPTVPVIMIAVASDDSDHPILMIVRVSSGPFNCSAVTVTVPPGLTVAP